MDVSNFRHHLKGMIRKRRTLEDCFLRMADPTTPNPGLFGNVPLSLVEQYYPELKREVEEEERASEEMRQKAEAAYLQNEGELRAELESKPKTSRPAASAGAAVTATETPIPTVEAEGEDWIPDPEMPGYAIDQHNRVKDIAGGKGRKVGRILTLIQTWVPRGKGQGKTHQFRMYYQITLAGKRKKVPLYQVGIRRNRLARAKAGGYRG